MELKLIELNHVRLQLGVYATTITIQENGYEFPVSLQYRPIEKIRHINPILRNLDEYIHHFL